MHRHTTGEAMTLLEFFKLMGDEKRLELIGVLAKREYGVGELAELLDITEPTVSHHLSRMRENGLVTMRSEGNNRFYRLHLPTLEKIKGLVARMETIPVWMEPVKNDTAWLDAFQLSDEDREVLEKSTLNGKLVRIPRQQKKLMVILRWLATQFEAGHDYTEKDVNAILTRYHEDYAGLRRDLVDMGFLERTPSGSVYRVKQ